MKKLAVVIFGLSLVCLSYVACGGAKEAEKGVAGQETIQPQEQLKPVGKIEKSTSEGELSWDKIPAYPGAVLEETGDCPGKWADCEVCEHRTYVTEDSQDDVCTFYKGIMPAMGWMKIVFQSYPEGSCMGTWMSGDSETRALMTVGKTGADNKTTIGITMGKKCP